MTRRGWIAAGALAFAAAAALFAQTPPDESWRTRKADSQTPAQPAPPRATDALRPRPSGAEIVVRQSGAGVVAIPGAVPDIEVAYRAFAAGDLLPAERMFTQLVERQPSPAAYLLRGCTRYTLAVLSRDRGIPLVQAREDIRKAFALNPSLWLDPALFSPRLRGFLDEVRREEP